MTKNQLVDSILNFVKVPILSEHLDVFNHNDGKTWVRSKRGSSYGVIEAELFSRQFRSWITYVLHDLTGEFVSVGLVGQICHYIEGSPANRRVDTGTAKSISALLDQPIVCAFLAWSDAVSSFPYQQGMADWYVELRRLNKRNDFPGSPSALSRKLKDVLDSFPPLGFVVALRRTAGGCNVRVDRRDDGSTVTGTACRQASNAGDSHTSRQDDDDAVIRRLQQEASIFRSNQSPGDII